MIEKNKIPREDLDYINNQLKKREVIRWIGQPKKGLLDQNNQSSLVGMSFAFIFFSAFITFMVGMQHSFKEFEDIFIENINIFITSLAASLLALSVVAYRKYQAVKNHAYIITNERAMVFEGKDVYSYGALCFKKINRIMNKDGTGSIILGDRRYDRSAQDINRYRVVGFMNISNPLEIENRLRELYKEYQNS